MPRFSGFASDQAPLLIQLKTTASGAGSYSSVFAAQSNGSGTSGSASRPVFYRPSTAGTGTGQTAEVRGYVAGTVPAGELLTSFSSSPPLPSVNTGAFNLPMRISWMTNPETGIIVAQGGALVLYQNASGGHLVSGGMSWEEL